MKKKKLPLKQILILFTILIAGYMLYSRVSGIPGGFAGGVSLPNVSSSEPTSGAKNRSPEQQQAGGQNQSPTPSEFQPNGNVQPVDGTEGVADQSADVRPSGQCVTVQKGDTYYALERQLICDQLVDPQTRQPPPNINFIQVGQRLCCP